MEYIGSISALNTFKVVTSSGLGGGGKRVAVAPSREVDTAAAGGATTGSYTWPAYSTGGAFTSGPTDVRGATGGAPNINGANGANGKTDKVTSTLVATAYLPATSSDAISSGGGGGYSGGGGGGTSKAYRTGEYRYIQGGSGGGGGSYWDSKKGEWLSDQNQTTASAAGYVIKNVGKGGSSLTPAEPGGVRIEFYADWDETLFTMYQACLTSATYTIQ